MAMNHEQCAAIAQLHRLAGSKRGAGLSILPLVMMLPAGES